MSSLLRMFNRQIVDLKNVQSIHSRSFKKFGHKRDEVRISTRIWHTYLIMSMLGFLVFHRQIVEFFDSFSKGDPNFKKRSKGFDEDY